MRPFANRPSSPAALLVLAVLAGCSQAAPPPPLPAPALDRSAPPPPGPSPSVDFPAVERHTLRNGLDVWIVPQREVPLVTLRLILPAGTVAEPEDKPGLASLAAAMLDEGTEQRTSLEIADQLEFLAAGLAVNSGRDAAYVDLSSLARNLPAALEIFADVLTRPTFPAEELERIRQERLTAILQSRDQAGVVASEQFGMRVFGATHPYGRPTGGTPESVRAITRDDLRDFYRRFYRPDDATLLVAGDVSAPELLPTLERLLGGWEPAPAPAPHVPPVAGSEPAARIYLIDKPGAAQSEIRVGHLGVPRNHRDYFPLVVLNSILGGEFGSRLNMNLREEKGYTYGAQSAFSMQREAGAFVAAAAVQTAVTKEALVEFMKELEEIRGARPVTEAELEATKASIVRREPRQLETQSQLLGRLQDLVLFDLPADYLDRYSEGIRAVTLPDVERVAREHIHPDRAYIVVVGDRAAVEAGLRELPYPVEIVTP